MRGYIPTYVYNYRFYVVEIVTLDNNINEFIHAVHLNELLLNNLHRLVHQLCHQVII